MRACDPHILWLFNSISCTKDNLASVEACWIRDLVKYVKKRATVVIAAFGTEAVPTCSHEVGMPRPTLLEWLSFDNEDKLRILLLGKLIYEDWSRLWHDRVYLEQYQKGMGWYMIQLREVRCFYSKLRTTTLKRTIWAKAERVLLLHDSVSGRKSHVNFKCFLTLQ